ncbi:MAG: hypothetical protein MI924_30845 [Chloroflexales bacterium]|nr:hypothetical protein [Chloroflexales bacterium]
MAVQPPEGSTTNNLFSLPVLLVKIQQSKPEQHDQPANLSTYQLVNVPTLQPANV